MKFPLAIVIFLIFLTLKLAEVGVVAHWSWWWVTAPLWGVLAFAFVVFNVAFIIERAKERRRLRGW